MPDLTAQRRLVKSPPELWSEVSEAESLARHLDELGEIRITKVEPETTVAWEGEQVSGTVELEQSGWGTKVTFRATVPEPDPPAEPEPPVEAEQPVEPEASAKADPPVASEPPRRAGFWARLLRRRASGPDEPGPLVDGEAFVRLEPIGAEPPAVAEPEPEAPVDAEPEPVVAESDEAARVRAVLEGTLEALGQAHHRPFSRG